MILRLSEILRKKVVKRPWQKANIVQLNLLFKIFPQGLKWNVTMIKKKHLDQFWPKPPWRWLVHKKLENAIEIQ